MPFDLQTLVKMLAVFGEETVRRMITIPEKKLIDQAIKNHDEPAELITKRDAWVDATMEFLKELGNLDND